MQYFTPCECGKQLAVSATQAGCRVACECGRVVEIPRLRALKKAAGEDVRFLNTIDAIATMAHSGELPQGNTCAMSGRPTKDIFVFCIQCEQPWARGSQTDSAAKIILSTLLCGWLGLLFSFLWSQSERPYEVVGRNTWVYAPMCIAAEFHPKLMRMRGQYDLKQLLRTVPIYAKLLDEYPEAIVTPMGAAH